MHQSKAFGVDLARKEVDPGRVGAGLCKALDRAHRHGIFEAIVPRENEKDLPDIPDAIRQTMKLQFVDHMDDVLRIALEKELVALPLPAAAAAAEVQPAVEETRPH